MCFNFRYAVLLLTVLLARPAAGEDSCFTHRLPEVNGRLAGALSPDLEVDQEDLLMTVRWPDGPIFPGANVVLSTPEGMEIDSWPAEQAPGDITVQRLGNALAQVGSAGFQYLLELRESEELLGWLTFRITVTCAEEPCEYRLVPGLESGPIAVSEAFWNALAAARAAGSPDLLAAVRAEHPDVAGEIPGFAWQLQQAEPRGGTACDCRWVTTRNLSTQQVIGPPESLPPVHESGVNMAGAGFFAGTQSTGEAVTVEDLMGATSLGLQLLCTLDAGGIQARYATSWPSMPQLEVEEPVFAPCRAPCTPRIEHRTEVRGCAQGGVTSRQNIFGRSISEMGAAVLLNGQAKIDGSASIDIQITDNELVRDVAYLDKTSTATLHAESAVLELSADAYLKSYGDQTAGGNIYAFSAASLQYTASLEAPPICGIAEGLAFHHAPLRAPDDGGVAMERWENP